MKARLVEKEHVTWAATAIQICEICEICLEFHIVIQLCMHNPPAMALRCLLWPILGKWNCFWFLATCLTKSAWRRKPKLFALLHTPVLSVCPPDLLFFFFFFFFCRLGPSSVRLSCYFAVSPILHGIFCPISTEPIPP